MDELKCNIPLEQITYVTHSCAFTASELLKSEEEINSSYKIFLQKTKHKHLFQDT
jgi:hypothetical protein